MGIEKNRIDQESLEQKPVNNIEQQESDPTIGLERAAEELTANAEKLDDLLKSEGGVDALPPEEQGKFSSHWENMKQSFDEMVEELSEGMNQIMIPGALASIGFAGGAYTMEVADQVLAIPVVCSGIAAAILWKLVSSKHVNS